MSDQTSPTPEERKRALALMGDLGLDVLVEPPDDETHVRIMVQHFRAAEQAARDNLDAEVWWRVHPELRAGQSGGFIYSTCEVTNWQRVRVIVEDA